MRIPVLFVREDSVYFDFPDADPFPVSRDARSFDGSSAVVAHPPCRAWGRLRTFAKPRDDEKSLARFAVETIRRNGGVLEHPASSSLWNDQGLPFPDRIAGRLPRPGRSPGRFDSFGGFTVAIPQFWFGHPALKPTWFYVCGLPPDRLPDVPLVLGEPAFHVVTPARNRPSHGTKPVLPPSQREHTPRGLAEWLLSIARSVESMKGGTIGS